VWKRKSCIEKVYAEIDTQSDAARGIALTFEKGETSDLIALYMRTQT